MNRIHTHYIMNSQILRFRTFKDIIGGLVFDCGHEEQQGHGSKSEWGAFTTQFSTTITCNVRKLKNPKVQTHFVLPVNRSDKDPDLLASSTLSDFQIVCTLAVGEFGHVDLVRVGLRAAHTRWHRCRCLLQIPCFYNVIYWFPPLSGAIKEPRQVSVCHEGP